MKPHILTTVPENWSDPILTRTQLQGLLGSPHHVLLALGEQAAQGHLVAGVQPGAVADLITLFVPENRRHHGSGRALVEALLEHARSRGCTGLTLEVRASNAAARALYARLGLREVAVRKGYYTRPVEDAVVYSTDFI